MNALFNFNVIAMLVKSAINGGGTDMATSLKISQSEEFKGFQKKIIKLAIPPKVFDSFSLCELA